jgi:hypothetical protein
VLAEDYATFSWSVFSNHGNYRYFPNIRASLPVLAAGVRLQPWMTDHSIALIADAGFELFTRERGNWRGDAAARRTYRWVTIDDPSLGMLAKGTLDQQGAALGEWVAQAFQDIRSVLTRPDVLAEREAWQPPQS